MTVKTLQIHSENILPIIKRWLYSEKDIFVREMVSNACDALHKMKILRENGDAESSDDEMRIDIKIDKEKRTIRFIDTGIGMDAEEVDKYIAQLAFSGAEEFVKKYQTDNEGDQIIGHFGLGFYSAFMVSEKVQIDTMSYKPEAEAVKWSCDGSCEYDVDKGSRSIRGTEIILYIDKENEEYLEESKIKDILNRYCSFLPHPIYLNDTHINVKEPLWMKPATECSEKEYLEFYRHQYPLEPDPLFWVHLNVDYPFNLRGILYFPKIKRDMDFRKNTIKLYCNRVFVSDNCQDLIPDYLMVLKGAIDSPDIPLNVSRSHLQMDRNVRQIAGHISKKVSDRLAVLYKTDRENFIRCWKDIEVVIKLGIMEDEKFYSRMKDYLVFKNTKGEWVTVEEYLERNKEKTSDKIFYTSDEKHDAPFLKVYQEQGIEVLCSNSFIDTHLMAFLEGHIAPAKFQRIDAGVEDAIVDSSKEKNLLDADGKTEAGKLRDFISSKISDDNVEVEAKSLAVDSLPAIITIDEQQRRFRDYMKASNMSGNDEQQDLPVKRSFVVNTNSPLVGAIHNLDVKDSNLAGELVKHLYDSSLLMHRELDPSALNVFVERGNKIIETLVKQVADQ